MKGEEQSTPKNWVPIPVPLKTVQTKNTTQKTHFSKTQGLAARGESAERRTASPAANEAAVLAPAQLRQNCRLLPPPYRSIDRCLPW